MEELIEIRPGKRYFHRAYTGIMLWFLGRAVQAAARVDREVAGEFSKMPDKYTFSLGAFPCGPYMVVGKDEKGRPEYLGGDIEKHQVHLRICLKSIGCLFALLSFQESTPTANARDRIYVTGDVPHACAVVRILDIVQVYLLPPFMAKLAVKRYPDWSLKRHTIDRCRILFRTILGY